MQRSPDSVDMCLARFPEMEINETTLSVPETCDGTKLLETVSGYDHLIASHIHHDKFYDKVILPEDVPGEEKLLKPGSEKKHVESGEDSEA
jgi:hypothetical protein